MKILITGSNGQLGKELVNQLEAINQSINQPKYVILATTRSDLDISNQTNVDNFILHNKPDVVVNCAYIQRLMHVKIISKLHTK